MTVPSRSRAALGPDARLRWSRPGERQARRSSGVTSLHAPACSPRPTCSPPRSLLIVLVATGSGNPEPAILVGTPLVVVLFKIAGLYDRDQHAAGPLDARRGCRAAAAHGPVRAGVTIVAPTSPAGSLSTPSDRRAVAPQLPRRRSCGRVTVARLRPRTDRAAEALPRDRRAGAGRPRPRQDPLESRARHRRRDAAARRRAVRRLGPSGEPPLARARVCRGPDHHRPDDDRRARRRRADPRRQGRRRARQRAAADARGRRLRGRVRRRRRADDARRPAASACRAPRERSSARSISWPRRSACSRSPRSSPRSRSRSGSTREGPVFFRQVRVGRDGRALPRSSSSARWSSTPRSRRTRCARSTRSGDGLFKIAERPARHARRRALCARPRSTSCRSSSTSCAAR